MLRSQRRLPPRESLPKCPDRYDKAPYDPVQSIDSLGVTTVIADPVCPDGAMTKTAVAMTDSPIGSPTWDDLAAQRWGPAIGDPTPGIVIDEPNREPH